MKLFNSYRIAQRAEAKSILKKLEGQNGKYLVVHYSCESFYGKDGYTPRVTSIGILNNENNESTIFSINLTAQILGKDLANLSNDDLDQVERTMLDEFAQFVKLHINYTWVHWNMRSASYGFQAISNRYRILDGTEINVPDTNKIDLSAVFGKLFTYTFEEHKPNGQLLNLANRNHISVHDALPGKDEAEAFEKKEYLKLHMSTLRKVKIIDRLLTAYLAGNLKHNARFKEIYDLSIPGIYCFCRESPVVVFIWSILVFVLGAAMEPLIQRFFSTG